MKRFIVLAAFVNKVAGARLYGANDEPRILKEGDRIEPPAFFGTADEPQIERLTRAGCIRPDATGGAPARKSGGPSGPVSHGAAQTPQNDPPSDSGAEGAGDGSPGPAPAGEGEEAPRDFEGTDGGPLPGADGGENLGPLTDGEGEAGAVADTAAPAGEPAGRDSSAGAKSQPRAGRNRSKRKATESA